MSYMDVNNGKTYKEIGTMPVKPAGSRSGDR